MPKTSMMFLFAFGFVFGSVVASSESDSKFDQRVEVLKEEISEKLDEQNRNEHPEEIALQQSEVQTAVMKEAKSHKQEESGEKCEEEEANAKQKTEGLPDIKNALEKVAEKIPNVDVANQVSGAVSAVTEAVDKNNDGAIDKSEAAQAGKAISNVPVAVAEAISNGKEAVGNTVKDVAKELPGAESYENWLGDLTKDFQAKSSEKCNATAAFERHKEAFNHKTGHEIVEEITLSYASDARIMYFEVSPEHVGQGGTGFDVMGRQNISHFYASFILPFFCKPTTRVVYSDVNEKTNIIHSAFQAPDCGADLVSETYVLNDDCLVQTHTVVETNLLRSSARQLVVGFVTALVSVMALF